VSAVLVVVGYLWKASCLLPGERLGLADVTARMCVTDIASLWSLRDLASHQFPYVHAVFTAPQGLTGAVEYPALSGILIWLVGLVSGSSLSFLTVNAVTLGFATVGATLLLSRMAARRVWLWAVAPAVLIYVVVNWDAWAVLAATAALAVLAAGSDRRAMPTARTLALAGALIGVGGALKGYPLLLLLPLFFFILHADRPHGRSSRRRIGRSLIPVMAAGVVLLATNVPIMIVNFAGWLTPFEFQSHRELRKDTMSVWYYLLRPFGRPDSEGIQPAINVLTLGVTAVAIVAILVIGWRIAERRGRYPLLPVSLAIVAAFVVLGKVSSPQYLLWLIPLIALVTIRVRWVVALYAVDVVMYVSWYQIYGQRLAHPELSHAFVAILAIAVFARAALILLIAIRGLIVDSPAVPSWDRGAQVLATRTSERQTERAMAPR
jgi:uncharacterized membrane protein